MPQCPKEDNEGNRVCNGFVFYPEYGEPRCSNPFCDWNLYKKRNPNWAADV